MVNAKISSWNFQVHLTHFPYETFAIESPIKRTGLVGKITSVNPSAMQYVKIITVGDKPSVVAIGNMMGIISIIFADDEPMKICKNKIRK